MKDSKNHILHLFRLINIIEFLEIIKIYLYLAPVLEKDETSLAYTLTTIKLKFQGQMEHKCHQMSLFLNKIIAIFCLKEF